MDAYEPQLGCILLQKDPNKAERPVGYFSRVLSDTERAFNTTERECLAIVWGSIPLRHYLDSGRFTILTYHESLE